MHLSINSYLLRFLVSVVLVIVASSPYFFHGEVRSSAAAPWLWAFELDGLLARPVLPTSTIALFIATIALLGVAAARRVTSIGITGWCIANALVAFFINFHVYAA